MRTVRVKRFVHTVRGPGFRCGAKKAIAMPGLASGPFVRLDMPFKAL